MRKLLIWIDLFTRNVSMQKKMFAGFFLVSFIPLLITSYLIFNHSTNKLAEEIGNYTVEITKQVDSRLDAYLRETARNGDMIRYNIFVEDFLGIQSFSADQGDVETITNARSLLDSIGQLYEGVKGIFVINNYNNMIFSSTEQVPDFQYDFNNEQWFHEKNTGLAPYVLKFHTQSYVNDSPVISYVSTIMDSSYSEAGNLIIDFSPDIIANMSRGIRLGDTGLVYMIDKDGQFVVPDQRVPDELRKLVNQELESTTEQDHYFTLKYKKQKYLVGYYPSNKSEWTIVGVVPFDEVATDINEVRFSFLIVVVASFIVILYLSIYIARSITLPIHELERSMKKVEMGNFKFQIKISQGDEIGRLGLKFNRMLEELDRLTEVVFKTKNREIQLQLMNKEAELRSLQSQINPHFLYNTLNTMTCIGEIHQLDDVAEMSNALASMFKYSISSSSLSTVEDEIKHAEHFIRIVSLRHSYPIHLLIDMEDELMEAHMLKLVLQPIVENAVFHGIEPKQSGGIIKIKGFENEDSIVIHIVDDGKGILKERLVEINKQLENEQSDIDGNHIGLSNVQRRLQYYYNGKASLNIRSNFGFGTTVELEWSKEDGGFAVSGSDYR